MNRTPLIPKTVLFIYKNYSITQNEVGDIEIINMNGDSFYIKLDDSKTNGPRRLVEMSFVEQLKYSIEYIDWVTLMRKTKN